LKTKTNETAEISLKSSKATKRKRARFESGKKVDVFPIGSTLKRALGIHE
jgi:hypothetical protein